MLQACMILFLKQQKMQMEIKIELSTEIEGLDIYYSFDNSFPDRFYPEYKEPLIVPKDASNLKVITYRDGKPIGRMITMPVAELKKRARIRNVEWYLSEDGQSSP